MPLSELVESRDELTRRSVTDGEVEGYFLASNPNIAIYKGILYAAPPVGELR
jgi:carboxylesterase type B